MHKASKQAKFEDRKGKQINRQLLPLLDLSIYATEKVLNMVVVKEQKKTKLLS